MAPLVFLSIAVGLWLLVAILSGLMSGWFKLAAMYPDQPEEPVLRIRGQSGSMGRGVWFRGVLRLSACPSGLRVGMNRFLGPFCRDFFVPWESVAVGRRNGVFGTVAELRFGKPVAGSLSISAVCANRLAAAAAGRWPEAGPLPEEADRDFGGLFRKSAIVGGLLAACLVPLLVGGPAAHPEIAAVVLFSAGFAGLVIVVRLLFGSDRG